MPLKNNFYSPPRRLSVHFSVTRPLSSSIIVIGNPLGHLFRQGKIAGQASNDASFYLAGNDASFYLAGIDGLFGLTRANRISLRAKAGLPGGSLRALLPGGAAQIAGSAALAGRAARTPAAAAARAVTVPEEGPQREGKCSEH